MPESTASPLRIGAWRVDPLRGEITRDDGQGLRLEARSMRLLMHLAARAGEIVSIEDLLEHVWSGVIVTPDSVYQAVTSLRRSLGDDAKKPVYIATVPRLGYRMVAPVGPCGETALVSPAPIRRRKRLYWLGAAALALSLGAGAWAWSTRPSGPAIAAAAPMSIAVLPFLDLTTQAMNEEYFVDGMTEEIINRLSTLPGAKVPGATASFYYKGKSMPVADVAKALHVAYVLDGSVRKSDDTFRVAARLLRARDGYVVWTQSYDRPIGNVLAIQKDLADEITRSLQTVFVTALAASH